MLKTILLQLFFLVLLCPKVFAQTGVNDEILEVIVYGRESDLIGLTDSASAGIIGAEDIGNRALLRVGELFEYIPGMVAVQHSGGGKANQYFLRGINLDHGSDFAMNFEGMPVNLRSHAHGNGYLDANFVIPELIKSMAYTKGTHLAEMGDFSSVGTATFETLDSLDKGLLKLTYGSDNYRRFMMANSWSTGSGDLLLGTEIRGSDGPWVNPEQTKLFNGFAKYSSQLIGMDSELIATFFNNQWNATDQIPLRAIRSDLLSRYGFIDDSVGGETQRFNLISKLSRENTIFTSYISNYSLNLFANPTYYLNDPLNGDQIEQEDNRWIYGGKVDRVISLEFLGKQNEIDMGIEFQYDRINNLNLFNTKKRKRLSSIREDQVKEFSVGVHTKIETNWSDRLRSQFGYRIDYYSWNVDAKRNENSGRDSDTIFSPKLDIIYLLNDDWELAFNYGQGFHTNDVRASELSINPISGVKVNSYDAIISTKGREIGIRGNINELFNISVSYFHLDLDSALIFVGDLGTTEPADGIHVTGIETAIYWRPSESVIFDLTMAKNDSEFPNLPKNKNYVPDAHDFVASFSATIFLANNASGAIKIRHFGSAPLNEDKSQLKDSSTIINLNMNYPIEAFDFGLEVFNLLNKSVNDIEYFYESRMLNETLGIEDRHFHPSNGREYRATIRYNF